jgi:hypothetical protein
MDEIMKNPSVQAMYVTRLFYLYHTRGPYRRARPLTRSCFIPLLLTRRAERMQRTGQPPSMADLAADPSIAEAAAKFGAGQRKQ